MKTFWVKSGLLLALAVILDSYGIKPPEFFSIGWWIFIVGILMFLLGGNE